MEHVPYLTVRILIWVPEKVGVISGSCLDKKTLRVVRQIVYVRQMYLYQKMYLPIHFENVWEKSVSDTFLGIHLPPLGMHFSENVYKKCIVYYRCGCSNLA